MNCKIATNKLRELFQDVDTKNRSELGFDEFVTLYHKLMFDDQVSCNSEYECDDFLTYLAYKEQEEGLTTL